MKIARVFATKTKMCPTDPDCYFDTPDLLTPKDYDKIHISVTFTWDFQKALKLKESWGSVCSNVKIGGCAFGDPGSNFNGGMYLKKGITITSRGCPNNCSWCFVPKREGKIRELPIVEGNVIQDNNLLACSKSHVDKVFQMLFNQKHIDFAGGLESAKITDETVEKLRGLRIYQIWLSYDHPSFEKSLRKAVGKLQKYFKRDKIRCYVLIGHRGDTLIKAEHRLKRAWEIGTLPFAMLYRDKKNTPQPKEWKRFQRQWMRPAITKALSRHTEGGRCAL